MSFLELVPVLLAIQLWGQTRMSNKKILMHIDNMGLVSVANKQISKSKRIMLLLRPLVLLFLQYNIIFKACHIRTEVNQIADALSRKQFTRFQELAPDAQSQPEGLPQEFLHLMSKMK